ncbi:D-alanyl-D-alanine carboxypeptidase/D-alanyl-D-alanine-endopeptidase [Actinoplanes sp. NPDC049265]|uniref:D-alanyl-D-alanine carboxypeptidase/D-alanyl-D-alanine endopeptidase n=1 Tax=Actinoplanes sp. NPDC049265 TaxID=3363902 RepID=UPI00371F0617
MRGFIAVCAALTMVVTLGPASAVSGAGGDPALTAALDQVFADARLAGAATSVDVRDATTGAALYERAVNDRLIPGSNQKVLTSIAALEVLGPDHRFRTDVLTRGGNLYLRGGGDPTVLAADLDALAAAVARSGVRVVGGDLVADDSWFDDVPLGSDWAWDDEPYSYAAPVSALSLAPDTDYDAGAVIVESRPGRRAGAPAVVTMVPPNHYVRVVNRAVTGAAGSAATLTAVRRHGTNTVVVTGSVPAGTAEPGQDYLSVEDPAVYAASVFRDALARHGVRVRGRTVTGVTPGGARTVATDRSMTLRQMLVPFLKLSNNMHAEVLVKTMGRLRSGQGSWPAGLAVADGAVAALGVRTDVIRSAEGSGLSRRDWLTTRQLSTALLAARSRPWFPDWYAALPIAGQPDRLVGGTLRSRMTGTPAAGNVHAKTGTLTGVNALSGYVTDAGGRRLVFSMIVNTALVSATPVLDAAAVTLAGAGGAAPVAARARSAAEPGGDLECSWVKAC